MIGFIALTAIYLIVANILGKIGLDQSGLYTMGIFVPVGVFLVAGVATRITGTRGLGGIDEFRRAAGKIDAVGNAMAGSAEWFSLFFIVGIIAALTSTNHDGISISVGALAGLAFIAIFVLPKLPPQTTISLPDLITTKADGFEFGKKLLGPALAIIAIFCALLFLIAQIGAGSHVLLLQFPLSVRWAAGLLLMPVVFTLLASGMRGLTFANILLIWVIAAAILLPVVWLSMRITGNPFAQLSYGDGALQPILELEEQLVSSNLQNSGVGFQQGNFSKLSDFWNFLATVICITAGTAAMPLLYSRIACTTGYASRTRSIGWMLIIAALLLSALPAFVIFMKFEVYRDLVGLSLEQLGSEVDWLMNWAKFEGGNHALVCGSPATDLQAMILACGNNREHVLMPSDLNFSPLMTLVGAGEISNMPSIYSAISFAGILSACATTAGIAIMVIVNMASENLIFLGKNSPAGDSHINSHAPIVRRLFVSRLLVLSLAVVSIWLVQIIPAPVTDFSLWSLGLAASAIFPPLILAIWWKPMTAFGALTGAVAGFGAIAYLTITLEYGSDWIAQNGNEPVWMVPIIDKQLRPMNAAIVVMPIGILLIVLTSAAENLVQKWWKGRRQILKSSP